MVHQLHSKRFSTGEVNHGREADFGHFWNLQVRNEKRKQFCAIEQKLGFLCLRIGENGI